MNQVHGAPSREAPSTGVASAVLSGVAIGVLQHGVAVSLAALVFSGSLTDGAGRAASAFIASTVIATLVIGTMSRMSVVIAGTQDTAAIVAAAVAGSVAATATLDDDTRIATVFVVLAIAAGVTGISMWLIGRFGLSSVVRFLPDPVVSGFVAGTGWLLFRGGVEVALGEAVERDGLGRIFGWGQFQYIVPALALGLFMVLCAITRLNNALVSVAILLGAVAFHLIGRTVSTSEVLEADGWLIGPFPADSGWTPIRPSDLQAADWATIASVAVPMMAIVGVSVVGLLLNLGGLEPILGEEIDMDHELRVSGPVNIAVAATGGLISYALLGSTTLARQLDVRGRLPSLIIAAIGAGLVVAGPDIIGLLPRSIAGGVLVGLGLSVLLRWVQTSLVRMPRADRLLSGLILVVIAVAGVLAGVGIGILMAALIFIVSASRLNPVHHMMHAGGRSNVERPDRNKALLREGAERIVSIELRGFLFFGSVMRLRQLTDQYLAPGAGKACEQRWLILDFGRVVGIDSTAATGIAGIAAKLSKANGTVVLCNVDSAVRDALQRVASEGVSWQPDLDHAIEWCEDQLLAPVAEPELSGWLDAVLPAELEGGMQSISVEAGTVLIAAGDSNRDLYFIDRGTLTAWAGVTEGRLGPDARRLRQVRAGAVMGEIAFVTGRLRSATVIADSPTVLRSLSRDHFEAVMASNPEVAAQFQEYLLATLVDRLQLSTEEMRDRSPHDF